ncbi:MAG: T9SS type A sorting domain-containing protein [Bacteroidetes bacterium]|nr:MAG: T9SS type A sorting domain-containing protein [Bacteroidota bacterium]
MKQILRVYAAFGFFLLSCLFSNNAVLAQGDPGTDDDGFIVEITSPPSIAQLLVNTFSDCGWVGSTYGPSVTEELCGQVVWAMPDSIGCTPLPAGSLDGKIALIRRGACNFSLKVYHAQEAGAKAVIVANHYTNQYDAACFARNADNTLFFGGMSGGDSADVVTIPSIFIQRQTAEDIDGALANGETVELCFGFPSMTFPATAYHYATPVSQVDTLDHLAVVFINREPTTLYNVGLTAEIEEPGGNKVVLNTTIDSAESGVDNLYTFFPAYVPPAVKGEFKVTFSNDVYTSARDTISAGFAHTDYTFASDNLVLTTGGAANDQAFQDAGLFFQNGALCLTNESGAVATHATFGLVNAADIYVPNPFGGENDINIFLYDADIDDDGVWEISNDGSGSWDDLAGGLVGYAVYQVSGTEGVNALINVVLDDLNNPGTFKVNMKPNHPYFISIAYDGTAAGTGIMPRLSTSGDVNYINFPTTGLYLGGWFSGWNGAIVVQRLQLEGFDPSSGTRPVAQLEVDASMYPNPATDVLRVDLDFGRTTDNAMVSLMDGLGKVMEIQQLDNFEAGQLTFNVGTLASGTYLLSIRTAEGVAIHKVAICH